MPRRITFSQYLIGQISLERPCFFYAYAGMWLHLLAGAILLLVLSQLPLRHTIPSLIISSFSLGILLYGLLAREYALLVNLVSYTIGIVRTLSPQSLSFVFLLVAIIVALVSAYFLLSSEYRRYNRELSDNEAEGAIPLWISVLMGTTVLLLCIYGLSLLSPSLTF